ncbi:hypothetical protein LB505_003037 [Fusarium chuoi]|nr:hypothetical protein LB505_003037 [Fusarium chuoi]
MSMIDHSVDVHGVRDITIGSCHRGRLTMLGTVTILATKASESLQKGIMWIFLFLRTPRISRPLIPLPQARPLQNSD